MQKSVFLGGLAGFVLGLAFGGAGVYLLSPGGAPAAPPAAPAAPPIPAAASPSRAPTPSLTAPGAAGPRTSENGHGTSASAAGTGTITGRVTGPSGQPLPGVLLRANPSSEWKEPVDPTSHLSPGSPPPRVDVEEQVREIAARLRREEGEVREATTDAAGAFRLADLPAAAYYVQAWLPGYRVDRCRGRSWDEVPAGGTCDFRATPIRRVRVSVLRPDGTAPPEASITCRQAESREEQSMTWSPDSPDITVDCGTWEISASAGAFRDGDAEEGGGRRWRGRWRQGDDGAAYQSEPETVVVGPEGAPPVSLRLQGQPGLLVRVVYTTPDPPTAARVAALRLEDGKPGDPSRLLLDEGVPFLWVGPSGQGALTGLEPGTYLVGVTFRGGTVGPSATVAVGADFVPLELRVPGEVRDWVRVWVRGPDGSLLTDATLACGCEGPGGNGAGEANADLQPDGSYRVEHYEHDAPHLGGGFFSGEELGLGPRRYFVRASSPRFASAEATYDPARDREVTVAFAAPAYLRVTVGGWAESPDRDRVTLSVEEVSEDGERTSRASSSVDGSGTARFGPLRPGRGEVVLSFGEGSGAGARRRRRRGESEVARFPVTLEPGEARITVPMASVSDLVVACEGDPPELQKLGPDGAPDWAGSAEKDDERPIATYGDLAPGRYRLLGRTGDMWVDVPTQGTVAFRPNPFNAYFLQVLDHGYLKDLGLRTGDLVVAVDGFEFKDRFTMDASLMAAKTRESSTFTILREGTRFDVVADAKRVEEDDGSYYQPWSR